MYLTGFADEAATDLDGQIRATRALKWKHIEARNIDGINLHDLSEPEFERAADRLYGSGVSVNCFGSTIANWSCQITDPFETGLEQARRAIVRMQRLGTRLIRIMSYAVMEGRPADDQMEAERFRRLNILTRMFIEAGLTPVHENCMDYGGMSWQHTMKLLEKVPGLRLVFDTGNPVDSLDWSKPEPQPRQSSWEFYTHVKEHIAYVHIKDGVWDREKQAITYIFPGEGEGDVRRILEDLARNGYDGGLSIEPHLSVVPHEPTTRDPAEISFNNYIEYGRKLEALLALTAGK
jgi:sugar phosphate isomerase/epimerase